MDNDNGTPVNPSGIWGEVDPIAPSQTWMGQSLEPPMFPPPFEPLTLEPMAPQPPRRSRGRLLIGAGLAATLVAVGGFAIANRSRPRIITLVQAAERTKTQHTARIAMTMDLPLPGLSSDPIAATGEYDFDNKIMRLTMDMTDALGDQLPDDAPADALKMTLVTKGFNEYMRMPALDASPKFAGKWINIDMAAMMSKAGVDVTKMGNGQSSDPSAVLDQMRAAGPVETVGQEVVRDVPTTHFRSTMDIEKGIRTSGAVTDEVALKKLLALYSAPTMTAEVWVDAKGLVRRVTEEIPMKTKPIKIDMEFYDFGIPVDPTIPSAADIIDISALSGKA
jgi:hypothetical protein